eukprot:6742199-Alexandrium_andersonii.AAC.1
MGQSTSGERSRLLPSGGAQAWAALPPQARGLRSSCSRSPAVPRRMRGSRPSGHWEPRDGFSPAPS